MYYADFYSEIPNGIVNKRLTGAGCTSFALENNQPTVVVVPTVALIQNKVAQYPNRRREEAIIGLYGNISVQDVASSISQMKVPKIMVTYDSFWKLKNIIDDTYHIVVDEMHLLLTAYNYRSKAINNLLSMLGNYSKVSYISATPIKPEYLPPCLIDLPYTELEWENITPVTVYPSQYKKPLTAVYKIIKNYKLDLMKINGIRSETAYFFLNSVTNILTIIKKSGLSPSEVRIICSDTDENKLKIKTKLGDNYKIETALDHEKMINFVTSNSFEGVDFYSESGACFVVSTNASKYTLVSLDTSVYQIAGRIRSLKNPFRGHIFHLFNENPLKLTQTEFDDIVADKIRATHEYLQDFKNASEAHKKDIIKDVTGLDSNYLYECTEDILDFDHLKHKSDLHVWDCVIKPYQTGLHIITNYKNNDSFEVKECPDISKNKGKFVASTDFATVCSMLYNGHGDLTKARSEFPLLNQAVDILGLRGMHSLNFDPKRIRLALAEVSLKEDMHETIKKSFTKGRYTVADVKQIIQNIYTNMGLEKKAKSKDIEDVFSIKPTNTSINGKCTRVYIIP